MKTASGKPKVAYVSADPGVPVFGQKGSSVHVQEVIRAMISLGADVELFAARTDGEAPVDLVDVRLHKLPRPPKDTRGDFAKREVALLAANENLDEALRNVGEFDVVYERYSIWSRAAISYANEKSIPAILEVNSPLVEEQATHRGLADRKGAEAVALEVFANSDALVAVSGGVAKYLETHVSPEKIHVVPNGVAAHRYGQAESGIPKEPGTFVVGFVGTLKPWHGLSDLVEAFDILHSEKSGARLLVVGDGPERAATESELRDRGLLDHAHFTGAVSPGDIPAMLASMDIAVAPYPSGGSDFYFSPLKVYEYMAAGLPVVASGVGQIGELIENWKNGLLYEPGDTDHLAEAMILLASDDTVRDSLGIAARKTVLEGHTWESVAQKILNIAGLNMIAGR